MRTSPASDDHAHRRHRGRRRGAPNLLDELDRLTRAWGRRSLLARRAAQLHGCDVFLGGRSSGWAAEAGPAVGGALTAPPVVRVAELDPERNRLLLRLDDGRVAALGAALELGQIEAFLGRDVATTERFVVDYCDPNATRRCVGHLRTVALGHALAASPSRRRRRRAPDADRRRRAPDGRAMAGYLTFYKGETLRRPARERPLRRPRHSRYVAAGAGRGRRRHRGGSRARVRTPTTISPSSCSCARRGDPR